MWLLRFPSSVLALSVCVCVQSLKWLDLKDNPLELGLAKAAGDCLDEKQCKQCATKVTERMTSQQIDDITINVSNTKDRGGFLGSAAHESHSGGGRSCSRETTFKRKR